MTVHGSDTVETSRREMLALLGAAALLPGGAIAQGAPAPRRTPNLALVSRHLQWTDAANGVRVAREAGFPAILWTVRGGAHVEAANVRTELPRIVRLTRDAGMQVPMIITSISDASAEGVEPILATMQELGIGLYRAGAPRYRYDAPIQPQFDAFRRRIEPLGRLNEKYGTTAAFHTHAYANSIGGSGWDLWLALRDLDPRFVGLNYDIGHVTSKGGDGWRESIRAVGPYLHSVSVKDFRWEKAANAPAGQWPWRTRFVAPGEGMVNFADFFRYLQSVAFAGPIENYFEYTVHVPGSDKPFDMLGTDYGKWRLTIPEAAFTAYLKRDLAFYTQLWQQALASPNPASFSVKAED